MPERLLWTPPPPLPMDSQTPTVKPWALCVRTDPEPIRVCNSPSVKVDGTDEVISIAYLLRGGMTLGPNDLHCLPILTPETFDFVRNLLVEEVGVRRMGMYLMVVWGWFRCPRNPPKVPV